MNQNKMKAKLIKIEGGDYLLRDLNGEPMALESTLSLKNCQAIERGYDLDELAKEEAEKLYNKSEHEDYSIWEYLVSGEFESIKLGFQKALEVNADKRFTLKEMVECWNRALEFQTHKETLGEYIKSLKQTEWDVEIEMVPAMSNNGNVYYGDIPKLDTDGCLILKRM